LSPVDSMPFSSSVLAKGCALLLSCYLSSVAAQDCVLSVPANPLSAKGLATPYTVTGCNQIDFSNQGSFVEAAIFDPATNQISVYHPLVVNRGAVAGTDFIKPVPVNVPRGATVGIWFGSNAATLTLAGDTADCVNGLGASIFGQVCSWSMPMTRPFLTVGFSLTNANLISLPTAMATSFSKSLRPRSLLGN
jgi:hypothetical protein